MLNYSKLNYHIVGMKPPAEESWWQLSWIRVGSLQNGSTLSGKKRSRTGVRRLYFPHLGRCEMWRNLFNIIPLNSRLLRPWWGNSAWQANCSAQFVVIKKKGGRAWIHALTTLFHPFFFWDYGPGLMKSGWGTFTLNFIWPFRDGGFITEPSK